MTIEAHELSGLLGHWSSQSATLTDDLVAGLASLIDARLLPAGATLPPQRVLAQAIGVSRGTVAAAYGDLEGRGYLLSRQGSGSRIRSGNGQQLHGRTTGRLFSFTSTPPNTIDLTTGALPASRVAVETLSNPHNRELSHYLHTDGYFPSGLPILRQAIAEQLTRDGLPTVPQQVLVTAGAQQATWVAINALVGSGDLVLVEEPSYRGALEAIRGCFAQLRSIPMANGGIRPDLVRRAMDASPRLLYCQPGMQNPTGRAMSSAGRRELAKVIADYGLLTIEDRCWADLRLHGADTTPSLAAGLDPELVLTIGTMSKLFWGGLRIGWIRSGEKRIAALSELLTAVQLGCSVSEQLSAASLIASTSAARAERRETLSQLLETAEAELRTAQPTWTWDRIDGGSTLWIDTHDDALALSERAKRVGVRLLAGPSFSADGGQQTMIRIPIWHEREMLRTALARLSRFGPEPAK